MRRFDNETGSRIKTKSIVVAYGHKKQKMKVAKFNDNEMSQNVQNSIVANNSTFDIQSGVKLDVEPSFQR